MATTHHDYFDPIEGLHSRHMWHALLLIFKYLNEESLFHSELTCKAWKAAIDDSHPSKLWNILFKQKIASSPLFKRLHFNLDQDSNHQLCSRKLLSKYEYTDKILQRNWLLEDCTAAFVDDSLVNDGGIMGHVRGTVLNSFSANDKFVAWYSNSKVMIWNRHSLKVEEVLIVQDQTDELLNDFECTLCNDILIYSFDLSISIRNLTTKKTESFSPPFMENSVRINKLYAMNGFLVAAILKEQTKVLHDVLIWKINSNAEVEWKDFEMIPNIRLQSYELFIDHKYMILIFFQPKLECVVRQVSNFGIKQTIKIVNDFSNVEYSDGYVFILTMSGELMTLNVDSGAHRIVSTNLRDSPTERFRLSVHSGYVIILRSYDNDVNFTITVKIWNIKAITNLESALPSTIIQPQFSFETNINSVKELLPLDMVYEMVYGDFFGLLFFTVRQTLDWTHLLSHFSLSIRTLNFLPNCSFCKQLKKSLRPCVQCKTVKYCDKVCQSNDWNHHQQICKRNSRGI